MVASTIAEYFRDQGRCTVHDGFATRFAIAQREVGLAIGSTCHPGLYTFVFATLPRPLERSGPDPGYESLLLHGAVKEMT